MTSQIRYLLNCRGYISKKMCFESPGNNCSFLLQEKRRRRKESKKTPKPTTSGTDNTENQIRKEAENEPQASEEATGEAIEEATEAKSNEIDSNVCVTAAATQPSINSTTVLGWDFVKKKFSQFSQIFFSREKMQISSYQQIVTKI